MPANKAQTSDKISTKVPEHCLNKKGVRQLLHRPQNAKRRSHRAQHATTAAMLTHDQPTFESARFSIKEEKYPTARRTYWSSVDQDCCLLSWECGGYQY